MENPTKEKKEKKNKAADKWSVDEGKIRHNENTLAPSDEPDQICWDEPAQKEPKANIGSANKITGHSKKKKEPKSMAKFLEEQQIIKGSTSSDHGKICIGMDFGTTFSCCAYFDGVRTIVIPTPDGTETFPSALFIDEDGNEVIGQKALDRQEEYPDRVITEMKPFLGGNFDDKRFQKDLKYSALNFVKDDTSDSTGGAFVVIQMRHGPPMKLKPEEIVTKFLAYMKGYAEDYVGKPIEECVLTVPFSSTSIHKTLMKESAEKAGFVEVRSITTEPSAAAVAYYADVDIDDKTEEVFAIYDLGGGTFDFSALTVMEENYTVLFTVGDNHLGGVKFTRELYAECVRLHKVKQSIPHSRDNISAAKKQQLMSRCEEAKQELSTQMEANICVDLSDGDGPTSDLTIRRKDFEDLINNSIEYSIALCKQAIKNYYDGENPIDKPIQKIIMVGGSTQMPCVKRELKTAFPWLKISFCKQPNTAVARGAAIRGAALAGGIVRNFLDTGLRAVHVQDILNANIGIETEFGVFCVLLEANAKLPTKVVRHPLTIDRQCDFLPIKIYEGHRSFVKNNQLIGDYEYGLKKGSRRNKTKIDVTLIVDANGIFKVIIYEDGIMHGPNAEVTLVRRPDKLKYLSMPTDQEKNEDKALKSRLDEVHLWSCILNSTVSEIEEMVGGPHKRYLLRNFASDAEVLIHKLADNWEDSDVNWPKVAQKFSDLMALYAAAKITYGTKANIDEFRPHLPSELNVASSSQQGQEVEQHGPNFSTGSRERDGSESLTNSFAQLEVEEENSDISFIESENEGDE